MSSWPGRSPIWSRPRWPPPSGRTATRGGTRIRTPRTSGSGSRTSPDLPPGADPLLRARAKVLGKRDEAAELRAELARIGLVVRDERKRQYVRTLG